MAFKTSQNCSAASSSAVSQLPGLLRQQEHIFISKNLEKDSPECLFLLSSERGKSSSTAEELSRKEVMEKPCAHLKWNTLRCSPAISHGCFCKWQPLVPSERKLSHWQCTGHSSTEGILKKKKKKISDLVTLLYNLRFYFLPLLPLFTPGFKPCFVGYYGSFSVVATSFLHDGRQKCLLRMELSVWVWKGLKRLISAHPK